MSKEYVNKILVVIDMQEDFVNGALGTDEAKAIVPKIKSKIRDYNTNINLVWATQDSHQKNYLATQEGQHLPIQHCIRDTDGWRIIPELGKEYIDEVFYKNSFGSTDMILSIERELESTISAATEIEFVGVCTDICVVSNALLVKTMFPEMKITVDASCCAGVTPQKHKAALEVMKSCHIDIINEGE